MCIVRETTTIRAYSESEKKILVTVSLNALRLCTHTHTAVYFVMNRTSYCRPISMAQTCEITKICKFHLGNSYGARNKKKQQTNTQHLIENLPYECKIHHGYDGHGQQSDCMRFVEKI